MPKYRAVLSVANAVVEVEAANEQDAREEAWSFGSKYFHGKVIDVDVQDIVDWEEIDADV